VELVVGYLVAALLHVGAADQSELTALLVQQLLEEHLHPAGCVCRPFPYNESVALVVSLESGGAVYELIAQLNRVCALAESYLHLTLTAGVGAPVPAPEDLPRSADGARSALEYRGMVGRGQAIYIGDLEPDGGARLMFTESDEQELTSALKLGGDEELRAVLDRLTDKLRPSGLSPAQWQLFFLELLTCLLKVAREADLDTESVFGAGFTGLMKVTDFESPEALEEWCLDKCLRIRTQLRNRRTDSAGRAVERAKDFIHAHYGESTLSVETLCEHLHLSPAYFSTLFKRETGMSFTAYVTVVRMEAAAAALGAPRTDLPHCPPLRVRGPNFSEFVQAPLRHEPHQVRSAEAVLRTAGPPRRARGIPGDEETHAGEIADLPSQAERLPQHQHPDDPVRHLHGGGGAGHGVHGTALFLRFSPLQHQQSENSSGSRPR
jgi:AraC-like DNA-binding protein